MVQAGHHIWIDGQISDEPSASLVPLMTHTLHYGVGAFEGIRAYRRADGSTSIFRLREHVARLFNSSRLVWLEPTVSQDQVMQGCIDVLTHNQMAEAYLRPIVFLGAGAMGLFPAQNPVVTAIVAWEWGAYLGKDGLEKGIRCKVSSLQRPPLNAAFTQGKIIGQYVTSVVAKREVRLAGYDEAILLDSRGTVAEGSGENLFIVVGGELLTPPLSSAILPGITRNTIMTLAREEGLVVREESFPRDTMYLADELFLTGTAAEVTPVREVDDRPIGDGTRGPITARLQKRYFDVVCGSDASHPEWLTRIAGAGSAAGG